jgi:hypothetical protein
MRCSREDAVEAGLVAMRAAGLEPTAFAKELAQQYSDGTISLDQWEAAMLEHYRPTSVTERFSV